MAKLLIIYDQLDKLTLLDPEEVRHFNIKQAMLSISEDLENKDIYEIAKKLAEMLLEQL